MGYSGVNCSNDLFVVFFAVRNSTDGEIRRIEDGGVFIEIWKGSITTNKRRDDFSVGIAEPIEVRLLVEKAKQSRQSKP